MTNAPTLRGFRAHRRQLEWGTSTVGLDSWSPACICLRVFIALVKHHEWKQLWEERAYSVSHHSLSPKEVRSGLQSETLRQELMQRPCSTCPAYLVFSYSPGPSFRGGPTHNDLGPPTPITNLKNVLQTCVQPDVSFSFSFFLLK